MSIFDIALSLGKSKFKGQGQVSDKLYVRAGKSSEIVTLKASHGSHSQHSSSR